MTVLSSPMPSLKLPETDVFSFIFDRNDRPFPEDHSKLIFGTLNFPRV